MNGRTYVERGLLIFSQTLVTIFTVSFQTQIASRRVELIPIHHAFFLFVGMKQYMKIAFGIEMQPGALPWWITKDNMFLAKKNGVTVVKIAQFQLDQVSQAPIELPCKTP